jgi:hypothetical protein
MARIKRGDVQAVFEAFGGGGGAILRHRDESPGAPADFLGSHGAIRPFADWDGRQFEAADWHVILIADIEGGDSTFTKRDAEKIMDTLEVRFDLDGVQLETSRTAVKRFLRPEIFDLEEAYYFQEGRLIPPFELAPGEHELHCVVTAEGEVVFENTIHFLIE